MSTIKIYRGTNQIGGIVTEFRAGEHRILIDFGANLPGTGKGNPALSDDANLPGTGESQTSAAKSPCVGDDELVRKVFGDSADEVNTDGVLFTHYHGDHVGLKDRIPSDIPMFIGSTAKEIMRVIVGRVARMKKLRGIPDDGEMSVIERMETYWKLGTPRDFNGIRVRPFVCDHSALDAYMFLIETNGKKILYTGDFRDHGIPGETTFERLIRERIGKVDILVTEGTMVSRIQEEQNNHVRTEEELGMKAREIFGSHRENVVLVSSTNLDSIMEFYHATPKGMAFLCDPYQAEVIRIASEARSRYYEKYRYGKEIYVLCPNDDPRYIKDLLKYEARDYMGNLRHPFAPARPGIYRENGFVMLARPNRNPDAAVGNFEKRMAGMDDPFITYSLWEGYLRGGKAEDPAIVRFMEPYMDDEHMIKLHTSGHAYVETLKRLMDMTDPEVIIPMHTEDADAFKKVELFTPYRDRIHTLKDGEDYLI